jgi:hypothetical protein
MRELKGLDEGKLLFYDIETAPVVKELQVGTPLFDAWAYKVAKDGVTDNDEVIKSFSEQAGLYPEFARVVCIVVGKVIKGKINLITFEDKDEKVLLEKFNDVVSRNSSSKLVGFVNIGFDSPFIFKRMLLNGVQPHDKIDSSGLKPWEVEEVDLSKLWQATGFSRASLTAVCNAFGLPTPKDDLSGSEVGKTYWSSNQDTSRISEYCRKDVVATVNVFKKMRLEEPLEVSGGETVETETPILTHLFEGGDYGAKEQKKLKGLLDTLTNEEREKAFVLLTAVSSTAKGKKTKLLKSHIKTLIKDYE